MTKKVYNAPYFKVVEVKNNIIATSTGFGEGEESTMHTQGRHGMWDDEFESDDLY